MVFIGPEDVTWRNLLHAVTKSKVSLSFITSVIPAKVVGKESEGKEFYLKCFETMS